MKIIGAGLAGLIAAQAFPQSQVVEAGKIQSNHKAVLRFRDLGVSRLTGVDFDEVLVRKGIWHQDCFRAPDIALCNLYSRKVLGRVADRSIWNTEPARRFVAPVDFHERLVDMTRNRLQEGACHDYSDRSQPVISTAPLPRVMEGLGIEAPEFHYSDITVRRMEVPGANVHQTVYFTDPETNLYRASITGNLMIAEFAGAPEGPWFEQLCAAFGFGFTQGVLAPMLEADTHRQHYGKIAPIEEGRRRALIRTLTDDYGVFSLGRFATWRNILLDDLVNDIAVIKRLINADDYDRKLKGI